MKGEKKKRRSNHRPYSTSASHCAGTNISGDQELNIMGVQMCPNVMGSKCYGGPNVMGVQMLWGSKCCGGPNVMGSKCYGGPNIMGIQIPPIRKALLQQHFYPLIHAGEKEANVNYEYEYADDVFLGSNSSWRPTVRGMGGGLPWR